jgi:hypothetical protein
MGIARIRSIKESIKEIQKEDSNTSISEYLIREMCKKSIIKSFKSGNKILLNYDELIEKINDLSSDI